MEKKQKMDEGDYLLLVPLLALRFLGDFSVISHFSLCLASTSLPQNTIDTTPKMDEIGKWMK